MRSSVKMRDVVKVRWKMKVTENAKAKKKKKSQEEKNPMLRLEINLVVSPKVVAPEKWK